MICMVQAISNGEPLMIHLMLNIRRVITLSLATGFWIVCLETMRYTNTPWQLNGAVTPYKSQVQEQKSCDLVFNHQSNGHFLHPEQVLPVRMWWSWMIVLRIISRRRNDLEKLCTPLEQSVERTVMVVQRLPQPCWLQGGEGVVARTISYEVHKCYRYEETCLSGLRRNNSSPKLVQIEAHQQ